MRIYSWNVNGIRAVIKKGALQAFIENHDPDILCIQETKAQPGQAEIDLPQYQEFWNSAQKKGYSGTAIFTKIAPLAIFSDIDKDITAKYNLVDKYGDTETEGRVLTAEFEKFFLVTVYTPNAKDDLSRIAMRTNWDPAFLEFVNRLQQKKPVIFCGDLNVAHQEDDLANPKQNIGKKGFTTEERSAVDQIIKSGFVDTFREFVFGNGHYTWWSNFARSRDRNIGWRIDYFFISQSLHPGLIEGAIHADIMGSDHCPVSITIEL